MLVPDAALAAALAARAGGRPLPQRLAPGGGPRAVAATRLTQLTRLTVATGDPGEAAAALGPGGPLRAAGWGLVAVRPLSDRVLVMVQGRVSGALDIADCNEERLGLLMAGAAV